MSGTDMKLVVVGAAGRMGQTLIRTINGDAGSQLFAAVERPGSPFIGRDAGEIAGLGPIGVTITDKPLEAFVEAEGVLDFTSPAAYRRICRSRGAGPHRPCHRYDRLLGGRRSQVQGGGAACARSSNPAI